MNRYFAYGQTDTQWQPDGDAGFKGVDMFHERGMLEPGYLALSVNKRLRNGVAKSRGGTSLPGDFNPAFEAQICGAKVYNNPNGSEVMLVATIGANYVWALQFGRDPIQIPLDAPQTIGNYTIEFVQAFDKVLLLRRPITLPTKLSGPSCTFTTGVSGDITATGHGFVVGDLVRFNTTDTLPASAPAPTLSTTDRYYVISVAGNVFHISHTSGGTLITFSSTPTATITVEKVAAVPILEWDGNFAHTFTPITLDPPGLNLVPVAWNAEPFANRLVYYNALYPNLPWRDQILVSDALNYTSYLDPTAAFRINAGESNMITRVFGYFRSSIVIFMKQGIHMLSNFTGDPTLGGFGLAQQRMLSDLSSVGNKMPIQDGADVIFLSHPDGFYRLGEVIQDQIAVQPSPFSRKIQPVIDQIDWTRAETWACSAGLGDYAYFALPLVGNSGSNNVIAVYNRTTREWESTDAWAFSNLHIQSLHTTLYDGTRRLFMVGDTPGPVSNIYLCESGLTDEIGGNSFPVIDVMETRGYNLRDPAAFKRFQRATITLSTYDPNAKITAISDGVNEEKVLEPDLTKDRRRSYVHGQGDFDPDTDDPNTPRREDYSTIPEVDFAGEDFQDFTVGPITFLRGTPIAFNGVKQTAIERFQIRQSGRWCSIRIVNINGQCDVVSVAVEGFNTQETLKVIA